MNIIETCLAQARRACKRLVLPEGHDERIVRAARRLQDDGVARPILLGNTDELRAAATARLALAMATSACCAFAASEAYPAGIRAAASQTPKFSKNRRLFTRLTIASGRAPVND